MAFSFSKSCLVLCLAVVPFVLMMNLSEALSASLTWEIPSRQDAFDIWAQKQRFHINDSIVFNYVGNKEDPDSVLMLNNERDYQNCNTSSNPMVSYKGGFSGISLGILLLRSGPYFFISGADGHCEQGQRVQIIVLAATHHHHHNSTAAPPLPNDNKHHHGHAPAPLPLPIDNEHHHGHAPAPAPTHHSGAASLGVGAVVSAAAAFIVALL